MVTGGTDVVPLVEPFSNFRVLSLLSSEEASFPESMDMALRTLRDCPSPSSPSTAACAASLSHSPSYNRPMTNLMKKIKQILEKETQHLLI